MRLVYLSILCYLYEKKNIPFMNAPIHCSYFIKKTIMFIVVNLVMDGTKQNRLCKDYFPNSGI